MKTLVRMSGLLAFAASAAAAVSFAPILRSAASVALPTPSSTAASLPAEMKAAIGDLRVGHYLAAIDRLDRNAHNSAFGQGADNPFFQLWQQFRPFLDERVDRATLDQGPDQPDRKDIAAFNGAEPRDALSEIVNRARHTRIVILNEAHHSPRDRAFGLQVARALRPLGYSILAIEALPNPATGAEAENARLAADGYMRLKGGYTDDPAFGDFIRQSLALGYRPVSYEAGANVGTNAISAVDRQAAREQAESDNLVARIFSTDSTSKVLIYVGYEHAVEEPVKVGGESLLFMAGRLKAATKIDPLTIDQTTVSEVSRDPAARRLYDLIAPRIGNKPVVFFRADEPVKIGTLGMGTDLQVIHPRLRTRNGRPTWLLTMGRHPVNIPRELLPRHGRRLVQAFIAGEAADAVPIDQVVVQAGKPVPVLMLPSKHLRFAVQESRPTSS
jgi:hypothetical protein